MLRAIRIAHSAFNPFWIGFPAFCGELCSSPRLRGEEDHALSAGCALILKETRVTIIINAVFARSCAKAHDEAIHYQRMDCFARFTRSQ